MNAFNDRSKSQDLKFDASSATDATTVKPGARAQIGGAGKPVAPDPINGVYGVLRALLDETSAGLVVHVVAVTPGEGSSTVARAIADKAAVGGNGKVLLLDGQMVSDNRQLAQKAGTAAPNVATKDRFTTPAPAHPTSAAEAEGGLFTGTLGDSGRRQTINAKEVKAAYAALKNDYELVIVDCPAVTSGRYTDLVPDAADWVILVIQAEKLRPAVIKSACDSIEQQGGKILGVVLNGARRYIPPLIYRLI